MFFSLSPIKLYFQQKIILLYSILFNGADTYVEFPTLGPSSITDVSINSTFSVSIWVNSSASGNFVLLGNSSTEGWFIRWLNNNKLDFYMSGSSGAIYTRATVPSFNDGLWHHLVFTFSGNGLTSGVKIYKNSVNLTLVSQQDDAVGTRSSSYNLRLGANAQTIGAVYSGLLFAPAFFNKELSQIEVDEIYNGGTPNDLTQHSAVANLLFYCPFINLKYPTVKEVISQNNGVMTNMSVLNLVLTSP